MRKAQDPLNGTDLIMMIESVTHTGSDQRTEERKTRERR